jgi:hypothetical protein
MMLTITPSGMLESSIYREFTAQFEGNLAVGHSYYDSLYRSNTRHFFDRSATFIVLSDQMLLLPADWGVPSNAQNITLEQFGISRAGWEYVNDLEQFAAMLILGGAFSDEVFPLLRLGIVVPQDDLEVEVVGVGRVDTFALQYVARLLGQIRLSQEAKSRLLIGESDGVVLESISNFLKRTKIPTPFAMPEISQLGALRAENFAGGLLNFAPPDALSLLAIRSDPGVANYAAKAREVLLNESSLNSQRALVDAMRSALKDSDVARRVEKVFEVESWVFKPLHYVPGIGDVLTLFEDGIEIAKRWMERIRSDDEWFLLAAKMTDVGIRDYLRRTGNL